MQKTFFSIISSFKYLFFIFIIACGTSQIEMPQTNQGDLKDLYNDPYFVKVKNNSIYVSPTNLEWSGYGHVNTEAEKVSFLVRAALVEANNVCPPNKRSKILGKPKIFRIGQDNKQVISGAELNFHCKNR
jgi:hypothetical protein